MITAGTFDSSIFPDCILRVHIGSVDDYNDSAIWQDFTIEAFSNGTTGLLTWEFANGTLFISGEGEMPDYYNENIQPWHEWKNLVTGVDIGEGITVIGSNAFHGYDRITSVSISGTVETIKSGAFIYNNFTSVTIPASVTSIDPMAMTGCFALTSITVDGANPNYTSVDGALYDKEKTTLITFPIGREGAYSIPEPVETIGSFAFCYGNLNSITIPASVKTIGEYAFYRTGITSIFIPELVANIGNEALAGCASMTSISVDPANPNYSSADGVLFNKDKTTIVLFPSGRTGDYAIPQSVETIGHGAFWENKLTSVDIPTSVTSIDDFAFRISGRLTSVVIPSSVTSIGNGAFLTCYELISVTIPSSVTSMGEWAFGECVKLSEIINYSVTPQAITHTPDHSMFPQSIFSTCILRVPAASVGLYRIAELWKEFQNIVAGLTIDEEEIYLLRGYTMTLKANVINPAIVSWTSGNTSVATVDDNGTITAVSVGTAVITASFNMFVAACTVTVVNSGNSSIEGTVNHTGTETVIVNLYIKLPELEEDISLMKGNKTAGSYILLAKTTTNTSGQYIFNDLPPGEYVVDVEIEDFDSELSPEIILSNDEVRSGVNFTVNSETKEIVREITTGTKELHVAILKLYPNPFNSFLYIEDAEGYTLRFFTIDGRLVHVQTITDATETVHLDHLPAGMYIIRIENGGKVSTAKVVKQ
jgi:hypothetical protein